MSLMGQHQSSGDARVTSAFLSMATKLRTSHDVGDGPDADVSVVCRKLSRDGVSARLRNLGVVL